MDHLVIAENPQSVIVFESVAAWKWICVLSLKMNLGLSFAAGAIKTFPEGSTQTDGIIGYEVIVTYNYHSVFLSS